MANITQRINKKGEVSYRIRVYVGEKSNGKQKFESMTWKPEAGMTENKIADELNRQTVLFNEKISKGEVTYNAKIKFQVYAATWLTNAQIAPKTRERYEVLLRRINEAIGHLRLEQIQAHHLESFYTNLAEDGIKNNGQYAVSDKLVRYIEKKKISRGQLAKMAGVALATVSHATNGKRITFDSANKICAALDMPTNELFTIQQTAEGLADVTIMHHHRLITAILGKARKSRIIEHNVASEFADAPKIRKKEARYLDDVQAQQIVALLLQEPDVRKKTAILLCLFSGIRRGEFGGLKWQNIDFNKKLLHIKQSTQWQQGKGIVEVPTKNESSERVIKLPAWIFDLLQEYRQWWKEHRMKCGDTWEGSDWVFIQNNGKPIAPNTLNF